MTKEGVTESKGSRERETRGGWDVDEEVLAGDDGSDMEGWEDDGWGSFEDNKQTKQKPPSLSPPPTVPSSGADFFDTFQSGFSSKPKEKDYFADFGPAATLSSLSAKREKSPPPPVSASLFGGEKKAESSSDGWGDWGSDFDSVKPSKVSEICKQL